MACQIYENKTIRFADEVKSNKYINPNKIILIYTSLAPDDKLISELMMYWNEKYYCQYLHNSGVIEGFDDKKHRLTLIKKNDKGEVTILFELLECCSLQCLARFLRFIELHRFIEFMKK